MAKEFTYEEASAPAAPATGSFSYEEATGAPPVQSGAFRRGVTDKVLGVASGALGLTKAVADAAGADNVVSRTLDKGVKGIDSALSPEAQADRQEQSAILDEAKGKGVWDQVKAGASAFGVAPVQTTAQGAGSAIPLIAASLAGAPAALATGVAAGVGTIKSAIFDDVKKRSTQAGASEADATAAATRAQEYSGENQGQIAIGGALGAADALTGVSRMGGAMLRNAVGKPVVAAAKQGVPRGVLARAGLGAAEEMPLEALQGGQEQYAANVASGRAGFDVDPMEGVVSNATLEALASAGPGAGLGALNTGGAQPVGGVIPNQGQPLPMTAPRPAVPPAQPPTAPAGETPLPTLDAIDPNANATAPTAGFDPTTAMLDPVPPAAVPLPTIDPAMGPISKAASMLADAAGVVSAPDPTAVAKSEADAKAKSKGKTEVKPTPVLPTPVAQTATKQPDAAPGTPAGPLATAAKFTSPTTPPPTTGGPSNAQAAQTLEGIPQPAQQGPIPEADARADQDVRRTEVAPGPIGTAAPVDGATTPTGAGGVNVKAQFQSDQGPGAGQAAIPGTGTKVSAETGTGAVAQADQPTAATPVAPATEAGQPGAPVAGEAIDGEWTAFSAESGTKGVPRADMPQIKAAHRGAMTNFLNARGITHEQVEVDAASLKPTQAEFSPGKVAKAIGFTDTDRSILISSDGHVLDGHHQWLAKMEKGETIKAIRLNAPIDQLMAAVKEFPSAATAEGGIAPTLNPLQQRIAEAKATAPAQSAANASETNRRSPDDKATAVAPNTPAEKDTAATVQSDITVPAATSTQSPASPRSELTPVGQSEAQPRSVPSPDATSSAAAPVGPAPAQTQAAAPSKTESVSPAATGPSPDGTPATTKSNTLRVGTMPTNAEPVTIKDGVIYIGKYEALNFDTGEPVRIAPDANPMQIRKALADNKALGTHQKVFGGIAPASDAKADSQTFVPAPDGSLDYGAITLEMGKAMRRQAGAIRLQEGNALFGLRHIEARHGDQIRAAGFVSVEAFVEDTARHIDRILKPDSTAQMVAVHKTGADQLMYIELRPAKDESGDYYTIRTAFPARQDFVERKGWEVLWEGRAQPSQPAASEQAPFAVPPQTADKATTNPSGQSGAIVSPATASAKPTGGRTLRRAAYERNPLMTFLAKHGLFHDAEKPGSQKAEFSPGKQVMVMGYGPVFRKTGMKPDLLTELAIEDGYLPPGSDESQLVDLIRRAIGGERIAPLYAEGAAETEMQKRMRAVDDLRELDDNKRDGIPDDILGAPSNMSIEDAMRALGFTEQEIHDATSQGPRKPQEDRQGSGEPDEARSEGPDAGAQAGPRAPPDEAEPEGLTAPTRVDVIAQQDRVENAQTLDDKAQIDREAGAQTLTAQTAPDQRKDNTGDMFAVEKAQATIDKRNASGTKSEGPSLFDQPAETEPADELDRNGLRAADRYARDLASAAQELSSQIYGDFNEADFDPAEVLPGLQAFAKDAGVPADELRQAVLKNLRASDMSKANLRKVEKALDPTKAPVETAPPATAAHKVGDLVRLTKPGVNGRINIAGTITKILPDGRLEIRTQQDGYMTVAPSELGHKPTAAPATTATTRSRPRDTITFKTPIKGPSGSSLVSYTWQWMPMDIVDSRGEDRTVRISDWDKADVNAETGRGIVHQFVVAAPDGSTQTVSAETAVNLLGFAGNEAAPFKSAASAAKTLARLRMQAHELGALLDQFTKDHDAVKAMRTPAPTSERNAEGWFEMGDARVRQLESGAMLPERLRALTGAWRDNRLQERGWKSGEATKDLLGSQVADIGQRIKRAEKKVASLGDSANPATQATTILDAANVTGKDRLDILKDVKSGALTPDEVQAAFPGVEPVAPSPKPGEVENFGETLPPARRNMTAKLDEALTNDDIANRPLSEIWPLAENDAIEDSFAAAVAHAARAEIPSKPRVAYKLKQWVTKVQALRELGARIVSGRVTRERFIELVPASLKDWLTKVMLLEQISRDQWSRVEAVEERPDSFTYDASGKQVASPMVRVKIDGRSHWLTGDSGVEGGARGTLDGNKAGIMALLSDAAPEERMQFEVRQRRGGKVFINKKGDSEYRALMEFDTAEDARKAITGQYDDLVAAWDAVKARDNITERDLRSAENRQRVGKDHRSGRDVTPEDFQSKFGFRGGEFGKWVKQGKGDKERQAILNNAYDALMDLANIAGIPPKAISLNGTLGIAFGSRGSGWASAHFEPGNLVMNLTKTRGAGALAHEWFHGLDNYFSRMRRGGAEEKFTGGQTEYRNNNYITHRPEPMMVPKNVLGGRYLEPMTLGKLQAMHEAHKNKTDAYNPDSWQRDPKTPEGVRPEVEARFAVLVDALNESPMTKRARLLDGKKSGDGYWSSTLERAARAFESYVIAKMHDDGYHNDFLVNVKKSDETGKAGDRYPYLMAGEVKPIAEAFDALFDTIQTREDDAGNVAMFARGTKRTTGVHMDDAEAIIAQVREALPTAPPIIPLESIAQAPADLRKFIRDAGAQDDFEAAYHNGKIFILPSNVGSTSRLQFLLAHHEIRHHGLGAMLGPRKNAVMFAIHATNANVRAAAAEQVRKGYATSKVLATEEALADMPVAELVKLNGFDKIVAAVREWLRGAAMRLRRAGLGNIADAIDAKEWTDRDVAHLIARAEGISRGGSAKYATEGTVFGQDGAEDSRDAKFAAEVMAELGTLDPMFRWPTSKGQTLADVFADVFPSMKEIGDATRPEEEKDSGAEKRTLFRNAAGKDFYVFEKGNKVWADVSRFEPGQAGDSVYHSIANYAYNTGRVFVGDPEGLSPDAIKRRTYHMLGSALRFGQTKHFVAAKEQLAGLAEDGIAPLEWVGNDADKIVSMIKSFTATTFNQNPKLRDYSFNFDTKQFIGPDGNAVPRNSLLLGMQPRPSDSSGGTRRTPAAVVFLDSLARTESGKRPGLLALVDRRPTQLVDSLGGPLFARGGLASAQTMSSITDTLKDATDRTSNGVKEYRGMALSALGRRQIVDLYAKTLPQLTAYNGLMQQMDADKNEAGSEADQIAQRWGKLKDDRQLSELMHDATLAQIDPEKPFVLADDKNQYAALRDSFDALSPDAKQVYRDARDTYRKHHEGVRSAIRERIFRSEMKGQRKAELLKQMDDEFYKAIKGVYFPLARFGDYVVVVRDSMGKAINVSRAETMNEAQALQVNLRKAYPGATIGKVLKSKEFNAGRDAVGRGFMENLYAVLGEKEMDEKQRAELEDMLGQLYLSALPDLSWAKHGIHRKGTPGFSQDARRAFAQNTFHGARYLAKVRYSDLLENELSDMQKQVDALNGEEDYDQPVAQDVINEMVKRHDAAMNPNGNALSTALTSLGFVFHLGLSPASAMVNLSQTALVAFPIMGAKWGFTKASAALLKASQQAAANKNDISAALSPEEKSAYDEAVRSGVIDVTMAHDLAGISQGEDAKVSWKVRPIMRWASFLFHHAEKFNRQVTFVASYRLAREAGSTPVKAYEAAIKATYDGHFDYSAGNRPRFMQGNAAKVILLFKQYGQNMVYTLSRQAYLAMRGQNPAERAQARKALGGLLAMHASAAGVLGLPMVSTLLAAASMLGSDDDEPWDAEVALRNMLADSLGDQSADVLARGLSRLTPWDISGRVGLDKLILPDIQEGLEGQRLGESAMAAALGPVAGIGIAMLKGLQEISDGNWARGLEAMAPTLVRGPARAIRYATDGAVDKTGKPIVDDVNDAGIIGQALGFSPSDVRLATEAKSAVHQADARLARRRAALMRHYSMAVIAGDQEGAEEARADIKAFNEKNPQRRINPIQMGRSVHMRRKQIAESQGGVYLPKTRRDSLDAGRFGMAN